MDDRARLEKLRKLERAGTEKLDAIQRGQIPATIKMIVTLGRAWHRVQNKRVLLERKLALEEKQCRKV